MAVRKKSAGPDDELLRLANVGRATGADFALLGIDTVAKLAKQSADGLYRRLNTLTRTRHDPCVWDTFAAAIHQAKTGKATPWWQWTAERKRRMALGDFDF